MEKLIFRSILLFLPLPPIFNVGFDFSDLLAEQERGGERLFLTGMREEGDILEVWKMVYFDINQYRCHNKNLQIQTHLFSGILCTRLTQRGLLLCYISVKGDVPYDGFLSAPES